MDCPKPTPKCYFCYNGVCYATHWYECSEGYRKPRNSMNGNKNNRFCKKDK